MYRKGKDKVSFDILDISPLKIIKNEKVSISFQSVEAKKNLPLSEKEEVIDQKLIKPGSPKLESQNSALKKILKNLTDKEEK